MRLHSVSLYNHEGDCLWLSEGALGPDEHNLVVEAIEALTADKTQPSYELGMEDGRIALFLAIRAPRGDLVGVVMILADIKSMSDSTAERIVTPPGAHDPPEDRRGPSQAQSEGFIYYADASRCPATRCRRRSPPCPHPLPRRAASIPPQRSPRNRSTRC